MIEDVICSSGLLKYPQKESQGIPLFKVWIEEEDLTKTEKWEKKKRSVIAIN